MNAAATRDRAWVTIGSEVAGVLARVDDSSVRAAREFVAGSSGRWFFTGQGRSGLVARMVAMRFVHLGRTAHVWGEATAPSIGPADHLIAVSASGTTPVTLHLAELATAAGADLLAVTSVSDSALGRRADAVLMVPATASEQFGGSLFEQCALLLLDALVLELTRDAPQSQAEMAARHTNLQ